MSDGVETACVGGSFATVGEILVDFTPLVDCGTTVGFRMHPSKTRCGSRPRRREIEQLLGPGVGHAAH